MSHTFKEPSDRNEFEILLAEFDYPFTQGFSYGEWHRALGRRVRRMVIKDRNQTHALFQAIRYSLPFRKNFLYIPHGPVIRPDAPPHLLTEITDAIRALAIQERSIFVRFDPYPPRALPDLPSIYSAPPGQSSFQQPQTEWMLDIQKPDEHLLAGMHEKTRYGIRLAERKYIAINIITQDFKPHIPSFLSLLSGTAHRQKFRLHPESYYQAIFHIGEKSQNILLVSARSGEHVAAANLIVLFGRSAYFAFGGSDYDHRDLMAPHLAHWRTIQYLREHGYKTYNFGGIAHDENQHSWDGFSMFKRRFGGRTVMYGKPLDMVIQPTWYGLYQTIKRLRGR